MTAVLSDMSDAWKWLKSDASLAIRIGVGALIFIGLALLDLRRHGRRATRWREYLFLLGCVAVALLYGVVNDQITSRISWEYYFYGKGLAEVLGPQTPPDPHALSWEAAKVGLKATWMMGLLIGVAFLLANNPRRDRARLGYRALLRRVPLVIVGAVLMAVVLGAAGYFGGLARFSEDFREMVRHDEFRPRRFMLVYGVHLGGYVGGLLGTAWAIRSILLRRRFAALTPDS